MPKQLPRVAELPDIAEAAALPPARLWAEFVALFVATPLAMTAFFGLYPLFPVLLALAIVAVVLLSVTPGFSSRELLRGPVFGQWRIIAVFAVCCTVVTFGLALVLVPGRFLEMPRYRPELWLAIMALYPLFSALPQELIFRPLFFRRYGHLFRHDGLALAANSAAFGLAHLFYMSPVTVGLTSLGGLIFGWVYLRHGSVMLAIVLHALAGQLVFTSGLGIYFYHGAVGLAR
jgi:membrane protease YdiL (CAAX protease family)